MDNRSMMSKGRKSTKGGSKKATISVYKELDDNIFEGMKMPIDRENGGKWLVQAGVHLARTEFGAPQRNKKLQV